MYGCKKVKFMKFTKKQLTSDLLGQLLEKAFNITNKRDHKMHSTIILGNNKHVLLDPVLISKIKERSLAL